MKKILNKYNYLTPIKFVRKNEFGAHYWLFKCDCGKEKEIRKTHVMCGTTISCGCIGRERVRKAHILPKNTAAINALYSRYKQTAKLYNRIFDISLEEFLELTSNNCYYCDTPPLQECKTYGSTPSYFYNGLDRIDNNEGYTQKNVLTSCGRCNKLRNAELSVEETKLLITTLRKFRNEV